jgi:hypothetical protein
MTVNEIIEGKMIVENMGVDLMIAAEIIVDIQTQYKITLD